MAQTTISWLRRYWAIVVAGLLVIFVAGSVSMARLAQRTAVPPAVSAPPR
jgi:hypothetical protein